MEGTGHACVAYCRYIYPLVCDHCAVATFVALARNLVLKLGSASHSQYPLWTWLVRFSTMLGANRMVA